MSFLERLIRPRRDPFAQARPLWHAIVRAARDPRWYRDLGVPDSVEGRFDMVTLVLALVMLRLEDAPGAADTNVRLAELFVEDMDAQLRQSGVGDLVVGKHVGKLMATLGGRLGALREALPQGAAAVAAVVGRNASLLDGASPDCLAQALCEENARLAAIPADRVLSGNLES